MSKVKSFKIAVSAVLVVMVMLLGVLTVGATNVKLNDTDVKKGDVVTYTLKLENVNTNVAGLNITINYDKDSLLIIKDTATFPAIPDVVYNLDLTGQVLFNGVNVMKGYKIDDDTVLFSVAFEVKSEDKEKIEVKAKVEELYALDEANQLPMITDYKIAETIKEGKEENIVKPSSIEELESSASVEASKEASKAEKIEEENNRNTTTLTYVIIGLLVLVAVGIVVVVVLRKKSDANGKA